MTRGWGQRGAGVTLYFIGLAGYHPPCSSAFSGALAQVTARCNARERIRIDEGECRPLEPLRETDGVAEESMESDEVKVCPAAPLMSKPPYGGFFIG